ncbi:hypothetical protein F5Y18DRAFT_345749 [Xylariaceae sp. FL1019]|nr:hypothetical protein F5Y18DRAFT_345749 [Xylariaceae sp. FL1019]
MYRPHIMPLLAIVPFILGAAAGSLGNVEDIHNDSGTMLYLRQDPSVPLESTADTNLNTFEGNIGAEPLAITRSDDASHPYTIDGETVSTFTDAINKACDGQSSGCSEQANGAAKGQFEVSDCDKQKQDCRDTLGSATQTAFLTKVTSDADFDFLCENV